MPLLRLEAIKLSISEDEANLTAKILKILGYSSKETITYTIVKKSIDSREKGNILFIYSVDIELPSPPLDLQRPLLLKHKARWVELFHYEIPVVEDKGTQLSASESQTPKRRPVIVGMGPAGLFAGLALARAGLRPIIIDRGKAVEDRIADVETFMREGRLDPESNIQFGEGGAGTFSDGKLYTMINDPRSKYVFEELIEAGAPPEIAYTAKAHVGTDILRILVKNLRKKLITLGAEIYFSTRLVDLEIVDGRLRGIIVEKTTSPLASSSAGRRETEMKKERIETDTLILAVRHSARDTYEMLYERGLDMVQKPFAMGVRIEHTAEMINRSQYGDACVNPKLGTASYKLVTHPGETRSVYSFCMCPGGHVVAASSEVGRLCVNGMSEYRQDSGISNSALLVSVTPADFGSDHPLAGIRFQREWEERAFVLGGSDYHAPAQLVGDFLTGRASTHLGSITSTYLPGVRMTDISLCLPDFITAALRKALPELDAKIRGFAHPDAVLTAIEARSSAVLRITRDRETLESNILGIYPSGEGAGYAGGITSSAIDGLIVAERIIVDRMKR